MNENELRERLISYTKNEGIKYNYIAEKLQVNKATISRFKNNKLKLGTHLIMCLNIYLNERGY